MAEFKTTLTETISVLKSALPTLLEMARKSEGAGALDEIHRQVNLALSDAGDGSRMDEIFKEAKATKKFLSTSQLEDSLKKAGEKLSSWFRKNKIAGVNEMVSLLEENCKIDPDKITALRNQLPEGFATFHIEKTDDPTALGDTAKLAIMAAINWGVPITVMVSTPAPFAVITILVWAVVSLVEVVAVLAMFDKNPENIFDRTAERIGLKKNFTNAAAIIGIGTGLMLAGVALMSFFYDLTKGSFQAIGKGIKKFLS